MNERIRELAEQAGWMMSDEVEGFNIRLEKFAELIVRECAAIAKQTDGDESADYRSGRTWARIEILEHFGVEE
jgi:hypothetical protein